MSEPVKKTTNRSAAPTRSGPAKSTPAKPTPAPAPAAKSGTAAQRAAGPAPQTSSAAQAPSTGDTVSQGILDATKPVSESTNKMLGAMSTWGQPTEAERQQEAKRESEWAGRLIDKRTSWYGNLDEEGLGKDLAERSSIPKVVNKVFDQLGSSNLDDVGVPFANAMTDAQLRQTAANPDGKAMLHRVANDINSGSVYQEDALAVQRLGQHAATKHGRLLDDSVSPEVQAKLDANGLKQQKIADGNGKINFDEFGVTIDQMPPGVTPEQFLQRFANNPNGALGENGAGFKGWCEFERREKGDAKVGDIYDIDIFGPGPENGSVIMRDKQSDRFTLSTVNGPPYGEHPIYGHREFGFTKNDDGSTTFYTRAADRRDWSGENSSTVKAIAQHGQNETWREMMKGMAKQIDALGGHSRPGSFTESWEMQ